MKQILFILLVSALLSCRQDKVSELPDPYEAGWNGKKVYEVLEDNDELRVLKCTFPPGVGHEKHYHEPHFGYALVGGTFKIEEMSGIREVSFPNGYSWSKDIVSEHQVF